MLKFSCLDCHLVTHEFSLLKKIMLLVSLIFTFSVNNVIALSIKSSQYIYGNSPYLSFDGGVTTANSIENLLSITLPDNNLITASGDVSTKSNPIKLNDETVKFSDIITYIQLPSSNRNYPNRSLNDIIINSNYWFDKDGDASPTVTGTLKLKWQDSDETDITDFVKNNINAKLIGCEAPYKLTLEATNGSLSTAYGEPRTSSFTGGSHSYFIYPKYTQEICYIQPSLKYEEADRQGVSNGPNWKSRKGFYVYDLDNPEKNFPTTGSDNLFFDLKIVGDADEIININGQHITPISGNGMSLLLTTHNGLVRVTLKGPKAPGGGNFSPSTFNLYKDINKTKLLYTFKIQRWYIVFPQEPGGYDKSVELCSSLAGRYRIPSDEEYTNRRYYIREISSKANGQWNGGILNEWGSLTTENYPDSDWQLFYPGDSRNWGPLYWTSTRRGNGSMNAVHIWTGKIGWRGMTEKKYRAACLMP